MFHSTAIHRKRVREWYKLCAWWSFRFRKITTFLWSPQICGRFVPNFHTAFSLVCHPPIHFRFLNHTWRKKQNQTCHVFIRSLSSRWSRMKIIAEPMTMNGPLAALHKAPSFKVVHRTNHPLYNTSAFTRETRDREYLHYQSRPFREPSRSSDNLDGHWHAGMGRSHSEHGLNNRSHKVTDYPVHPKTGLPLENGMVYPRYEDHLGTLPLSAEIRALRRIQSTEQVNQLPPWGGSGRPVQRHQSVREPMMSMVPEESSLLSHLSQMGGPKGQGGTVTKDRVSTTLSQIRTVGTVSVSAEHLNNDAPPPPRQTPVDPQHVYSTLPRTSKGQYSGDNGNPRHGNDPPRVYTNGTLKRKISPGSKSLGSKSGDGIFSRGNSLKQGKMVNKSTSMVGDKSPLSTLTRMPGDGAVVSNEFLATPEEESQQMVEFLPDYSDSEEETFGPPGIGYGLGRKKPNGMATMYRVGSLRQINQKNGKLTEELHRAKSDGLLFDQSDSVTFEGKPHISSIGGLVLPKLEEISSG